MGNSAKFVKSLFYINRHFCTFLVFKCTYRKANAAGPGTDVAVKVMTTTMTPTIDFETLVGKTWDEAAVVHHAHETIDNDCVVRLYGVVEGLLPAKMSTAAGFIPQPDERAIGIVMSYEKGG
jgi:hypothetical protein